MSWPGYAHLLCYSKLITHPWPSLASPDLQNYCFFGDLISPSLPFFWINSRLILNPPPPIPPFTGQSAFVNNATKIPLFFHLTMVVAKCNALCFIYFQSRLSRRALSTYLRCGFTWKSIRHVADNGMEFKGGQDGLPCRPLPLGKGAEIQTNSEAHCSVETNGVWIDHYCSAKA